MKTAIVTGLFSLITALVSSWFTSKSKNKEIELQREIKEKEIETLKSQHKHNLDKIKLEHQHEIDKIKIEVQTQLELSSQTNLDGLVQQQFSKQFDDPNSPMSKFFNDLMQEEIMKVTPKSNPNNQKRNKRIVNRNN